MKVQKRWWRWWGWQWRRRRGRPAVQGEGVASSGRGQPARLQRERTVAPLDLRCGRRRPQAHDAVVVCRAKCTTHRRGRRAARAELAQPRCQLVRLVAREEPLALLGEAQRARLITGLAPGPRELERLLGRELIRRGGHGRRGPWLGGLAGRGRRSMRRGGRGGLSLSCSASAAAAAAEERAKERGLRGLLWSWLRRHSRGRGRCGRTGGHAIRVVDDTVRHLIGR